MLKLSSVSNEVAQWKVNLRFDSRPRLSNQASHVTTGCTALDDHAVFAIPALYHLFEADGLEYAIRIPANDVLMANISYQAQSWDHPRRVVAKAEWPEGKLFPRVGVIVTNMAGWSKKVVQFYSPRGMAERWIKEGK